MARTTARDADACRACERRARGVATVTRDFTDVVRASSTRRGVRFNFVKRLKRRRAKAGEIAERIQPLGWHIVIYRSAGSARSVYSAAADDRGGRSHGSSGHAAADRAGVELFIKPMRSPRHLVEGARSLERWQRSRRLRSCAVRAPYRRDISGPSAVGHRLAAPELEDTHAGRRPPRRPATAYRAHAAPAPEAAGRQPDASLLGQVIDTYICHSTSPISISPARPSSTPTSRARAITSTASACRC